MKKIILPLCLFTVLSVSAQKPQYYDWQWKPCDVSKARFASLTDETDSGWVRRDFYLSTKKSQMKGLYKDSSFKIRNGWFRYFYANQVMSSQGNYVNGKKDGLWVSYHYNGMMKDSILYDLGYPLSITAWYSNGAIADSSVSDKEGNSIHRYWFDNGNPSGSGKTYRGKKEGIWNYFHKNGNRAATEKYESDRLISRIYYDEAGVMESDTTNRDRDAVFKGGVKKWKAFLTDKLIFPPGVKLVNTEIITVVIAAVIDEEGNISDAYVEIPFNDKFDNEALRVINKSPKWEPAISHNRKVKHYIRQPVSFGQYDF